MRFTFARLALGVAAIAALTAAAPKYGDFGFDSAGMDRSIKPGDDFFGYANGGWDKATPFPSDKPGVGAFVVLDDLSIERSRTILETEAAQAAPGSNAHKAADYYRAFTDEAAIEARGMAPVKAEIAQIDQIRDRNSLASAIGRLARTGVPTPFGIFVNVDDKDPDTYRPTLGQGGLGLPDRDYYLVDNPSFAKARERYKTHIASMLKLAGYPDPEGNAAKIYAMEEQFARVHWTRVESRDADKTYNLRTVQQIIDENPGFDWRAFFDATGLDRSGSLIVSQPSAIAGEMKVLGAAPLDTVKAYLAFKTIGARASVLPKAVFAERFDFSKVLNGTPEPEPRWKRGVRQTTDMLGEAVGEVYVAKYFPPATKAKADELVSNILASMRDRLGKVDFLDAATREKALVKLARFNPKIGYPSKWRDYSALEVRPDDAYGNRVRAVAFEFDRNAKKLGTRVDRSEWFMTPMEINAYANFTWNEIVFPAAILQPPFFDPNADDAVNYGAIGAIIGHEISHHFDDQGRKYDADGRLKEWWSKADVERFAAKTKRLVAQYNSYEPFPGTHINGELTLGENIADVVGIQVAYDAYQRSLKGKPAPVIDGTTGDQRFYLGYAQAWRAKYRPEFQRQLLTIDPHAPDRYRAQTVRNVDPFYRAFDVKPGDKLYLAPADRVTVW
ncbi:MAG: M13 family metallopeptidase [Sphingomonadaceae bacterium]|nr:M13 family metallopeptidase [Sphingomonadaceae bacterium]